MPVSSDLREPAPMGMLGSAKPCELAHSARATNPTAAGADRAIKFRNVRFMRCMRARSALRLQPRAIRTAGSRGSHSDSTAKAILSKGTLPSRPEILPRRGAHGAYPAPQNLKSPRCSLSREASACGTGEQRKRYRLGHGGPHADLRSGYANARGRSGL